MLGLPNPRAEELPEKVEVKQTTRSQAYEDIKNFLKIAFKLLAVSCLLYGAYRVFSWYVFLGFFLALPLTYAFFYMILRVPSRLVLVLHFAEDPEDSEKIAIFDIPEKKFQEFEFQGDNRVEFNTLTGQSLVVADNIDFKRRLIKAPWFAELSNLEFFKEKQAFQRVKEWVIHLFSERAEVMANREMMLLKDYADFLERHYANIDADLREPKAVAADIERFLMQKISLNGGGDGEG